MYLYHQSQVKRIHMKGMKLLPLYCLTYTCSYPNTLSIKETLLIYFKPLFYMLKPFFTNICFLMPLQLTTFKNIVKKAEIILNEQFLLLPKCLHFFLEELNLLLQICCPWENFIVILLYKISLETVNS